MIYMIRYHVNRPDKNLSLSKKKKPNKIMKKKDINIFGMIFR